MIHEYKGVIAISSSRFATFLVIWIVITWLGLGCSLVFGVGANDSIIRDIFAPEPVCFPHSIYLFNRDVLCLWKEEVYEDSHNDDKAGEEIEETKLHMAKQGEEALSNYECEQHVDRDVDGLACWSDLKRADFTGYQPSQWAPGPSKCSYIKANEEQKQIGFGIGKRSNSTNPKFQPNHGSNCNLRCRKSIN